MDGRWGRAESSSPFFCSFLGTGEMAGWEMGDEVDGNSSFFLGICRNYWGKRGLMYILEPEYDYSTIFSHVNSKELNSFELFGYTIEKM